MKASRAGSIQREATAHHEAGHAVVAIATGIMRLDGPIECDAKRAHVMTKGREDRIQDWMERGGDEARWNEMKAIVAAAGAAAESRYLREAGRKVDRKRLLADACQDVAEVTDLFGAEAWEKYREKAGRMIAQADIWDAVKLLASHLLRRWPEPLAAAEVHELLQPIEPATPRLRLED